MEAKFDEFEKNGKGYLEKELTKDMVMKSSRASSAMLHVVVEEPSFPLSRFQHTSFEYGTLAGEYSKT